MRYAMTSMYSAFVALTLMSTAQAADTVFVPASDYQIAQRADRGLSQEERDAEEERADREAQRRDRAEARRERAEQRREEEIRGRRDEEIRERREVHHEFVTPRVRAWAGIGAGVGAANIAVPCGNNPPSADKDCEQSGTTGTYTANVTISGPYTALRVRGIRQQDKGDDDRTPYEEAILVGSRFGYSNWYGLAGYGRVLHADDRHPEPDGGFAWEILFAPSTLSATGLELSFQGNLASDVSFVAVNLGVRFGALR